MNNFEASCGGMVDVPHWFAWRLTANVSSGRYEKQPCTLDGARYPINAGDPANWSDFDAVAAAVAMLDVPGASVRYAMGYWLTADCPYWFLDLDHAQGADNQWLPLALRFCDAYPGAMVEVSSSGTGLHVIGMGQVLPHRNKPPREIAEKLAPLALEFYSEGRGIAFGLDGHVQGCADTEFDMAPLVNAYFPPNAPASEQVNNQDAGFRGSDEQLIERALSARDSAAVTFGGRTSFADLWHGRAEKNSDNDAALIARLLWWTGGAIERTESLALRSGMRRDKWNERRPGGTYLTHTIAEMSAKVDRYYQEPTNAASDDGASSATSELANAVRLVKAHGTDLMYVPGVGWHIWIGNGPWQSDDGHARRLAFGLGKMIKAEAEALDAWVADQDVNGSDEQKRRAGIQKNLYSWARSSEFVVSVRHTLEAAQTMLTVKADLLDASATLVGTPGGVIDLATGTQREHRRDDLITKRIACDYDPAAKASTWAAFIDRIMGSDAELIRYLQTLCGYMLSGERGEHALPVFYGSGANGKSTFLATIQSVLGDYAGTAAPGLLLARKDNDQLAAIAGLRGLRLVVVSESGETERLDESRVKQITGGDRLTGRPLYQNYVEFTPTHLALLQTNHRPRINGTDDGIWRRLKLIPFAITIPESERDPQLSRKLRDELPGILAWMVEGWRMYQRGGFKEPQAVKMATADYRSASDQVGQFIAERCAEGLEHTSTAGAIYAAYKFWCVEHGENPMSQRSLGLKLSERPGIVQGRSMSTRTWRGLGIASHEVSGAISGQVVPLARKL